MYIKLIQLKFNKSIMKYIINKNEWNMKKIILIKCNKYVVFTFKKNE